MKPVRVNLFGGPSTGKSNLGARLFSALGARGYNVEFVDEVIKPMAWEHVRPKGFDPVWLVGNQMHAEDIVLRNGGTVVSAGPLYQQCAYLRGDGNLSRERLDLLNALLLAVGTFELRYPSVNIYLTRNVPFNPNGRYQKRVEEALALDSQILSIVSTYALRYSVWTPPRVSGTFIDGFEEKAFSDFVDFVCSELFTLQGEKPCLPTAATPPLTAAPLPPVVPCHNGSWLAGWTPRTSG